VPFVGLGRSIHRSAEPSSSPTCGVTGSARLARRAQDLHVEEVALWPKRPVQAVGQLPVPAGLPGPPGPQEQRQHLDGQDLAPVVVDPEVGPLPTLLVADVRLYPAKGLVDVEFVEGDVVDLVAGAGELGGQLAVGVGEVLVPGVDAAPGGRRLRLGGPLEPDDVGLQVGQRAGRRGCWLGEQGRCAHARSVGLLASAGQGSRRGAWQLAAGASPTGAIRCVEAMVRDLAVAEALTGLRPTSGVQPGRGPHRPPHESAVAVEA
jgi:hypothetical protein